MRSFNHFSDALFSKLLNPSNISDEHEPERHRTMRSMIQQRNDSIDIAIDEDGSMRPHKNQTATIVAAQQQKFDFFCKKVLTH